VQHRSNLRRVYAFVDRKATEPRLSAAIPSERVHLRQFRGATASPHKAWNVNSPRRTRRHKTNSVVERRNQIVLATARAGVRQSPRRSSFSTAHPRRSHSTARRPMKLGPATSPPSLCSACSVGWCTRIL
jgi:hypothetical protein